MTRNFSSSYEHKQQKRIRRRNSIARKLEDKQFRKRVVKDNHRKRINDLREQDQREEFDSDG